MKLPGGTVWLRRPGGSGSTLVLQPLGPGGEERREREGGESRAGKGREEEGREKLGKGYRHGCHMPGQPIPRRWL